MTKMLVLNAIPYDFEDEKHPGRKIVGVSINFVTGDPMPKERGMGWEVTKTSMQGPDARKQLVEVPGVYEADWEVGRGFDGKPTVKLKKLTFEGPAMLNTGQEGSDPDRDLVGAAAGRSNGAK